MRFTVGINHCNCHPKTCSCNDWAVYESSEKHSTHFYKEDAEALAKYLNQSATTLTKGIV